MNRFEVIVFKMLSFPRIIRMRMQNIANAHRLHFIKPSLLFAFQGNDCSKALRNFYSGNQKVLGIPQTARKLNSAYYLSSNILIIISSLFIIVVLEL